MKQLEKKILKPEPEGPKEYEASIRRAFVDGRADYIVLDSRRDRYLHHCAAWGQEQGWLSDYSEITDGQCTQWRIRLTQKGKEHFGLAKVAT